MSERKRKTWRLVSAFISWALRSGFLQTGFLFGNGRGPREQMLVTFFAFRGRLQCLQLCANLMVEFGVRRVAKD